MTVPIKPVRKIPGSQKLNLRLRDLNRTLARLAVPAVAETFLFSMVFFVDTVIVGWLRDDTYLAATAIAGVLMFLFNAPFIALAISVSSLVSRSWGEQDYSTARNNAGTALSMSFVLSGILSILGILFTGWILRLFGARPEVLPSGVPYFKILLLSCVLGQPMILMNNILRTMGQPMRAMCVTGIMNVLNIICSVCLAFGIGVPEMGFYGVAWGTVLSRSIGAFIALYFLFSGRGMQLRGRHFLAFSPALLRRMWYLTAPALAERFSTTLSYSIFMRLVAAMGTTTLAAHQLALQMESFAFMPAWGLAIAATTITGQAIGAGLEHIAEIAVKRILLAAIGLMLLIGAIFALGGPILVRLYGSTEPILHMAGLAIRISALELPFFAFSFVFMGCLRGAGDTRSPLYVGLSSSLIFRLGGVGLLCFVFDLGLPGVWLATALDWLARSVVFWLLFRRGIWKRLHQREKERFGV